MNTTTPVDTAQQLDLSGALAVLAVLALWAVCWWFTQRATLGEHRDMGQASDVYTMLEIDEAAQGIRSAHTPTRNNSNLCQRCETSWPCETYQWQEQWLEHVSRTESACAAPNATSNARGDT